MSGEGPYKRTRLRSSKSASESVEAPKDLKFLASGISGTSEAYQATIDQDLDPVHAALLSLFCSEDERVLEHACSSLTVLSGSENEQLGEPILDPGLYRRFLELDGHPIAAALRTLGNMMEGNTNLIDCCINSGQILDKLRKFLADDRVEVHTQAFRIVSYITAGKWRWIQTNRDVSAAVENQIDVRPKRAMFHDEEKTGTTTCAILCGDTVFSGTDTQAMEPYFGNVTNINKVKSHWLCADVFALGSGVVGPIHRVTGRVNNSFKSRKPQSVLEVAKKVVKKANKDDDQHKDKEQNYGFIVFGKHSTSTQPEIYTIDKDHETDLGREAFVYNRVHDEATDGTGGRFVKIVLNKERSYVEKCKESGNGVACLKYLLIRAMEKAKTNDMYTGGSIQMITVGQKRKASLFEKFDPIEPKNATSKYKCMTGTFTPVHM